MTKSYIVINLNKAESAETRLERIRERSRWFLFSVLIIVLLSANGRVWMINSGYNAIIDQKKSEISRLKNEIKKLQSRGKNLSKEDILSFAELEQNRFLWSKNLEMLGSMTPDDMAITGLRFKRHKMIINGIAITFDDRKDFEIIDEYLQTLKSNKNFSDNFSRIKLEDYGRISIRGQEIIRFEFVAAVKKKTVRRYS
ncbi:MAG: hypothetical protein CMG74_07020 [Candidatus Marinimicrobia bacterium]|nr:hypothetical protein [Candidatus Neomarinimicrobiota bacterium]